MEESSRVHWRATAGGVTTKATMSTSPTAFTPATVAIASMANMAASIALPFSPSTVQNSGSNARSENSFHRASVARIAQPPTIALEVMSAFVSVEALPKRNAPIPPLPGRELLLMN